MVILGNEIALARLEIVRLKKVSTPDSICAVKHTVRQDFPPLEMWAAVL